MANSKQGRPDRIAEAIGIILASVTMMAFADAIVKLVSADLTVWQVFFTRSLLAFPLVVILALVSGVTVKPRVFAWTLLRSALLVLTWLAFYASLPVLDLSIAAVAVYTNPILIALLSAMLLGDRVVGRQWLGVFLGFLGVIAILKPGTDDFSWLILLPLLAAAFYALAMVLTRAKCQDETPLALAFALHGTFIVTGLAATALLASMNLSAEVTEAYPFLLGGWAEMGWREWGLMGLLAVLSTLYFLGVARAYQTAPPQIIATFDYGYLVSAAFWGFIFFAETPDGFTILGMVLIAAAGWIVAARRAPRDGGTVST